MQYFFLRLNIFQYVMDHKCNIYFIILTIFIGIFEQISINIIYVLHLSMTIYACLFYISLLVIGGFE